MIRIALAFSLLLWNQALPAAEIGDDGLHKQDWFLDSFLELADDRAEAAAEGKGLIVLFEQRGCPYCRELHDVNFAKPEIADYIQANFHVLQLDLWGSREVTDFDGEAIEERDLARRWGVMFTPTLVFFDGTETTEPQPGNALETFRMPGYFKPFHFISALEFVALDKHRQTDFQRYLQEKFAEFEARGEEPDVW